MSRATNAWRIVTPVLLLALTACGEADQPPPAPVTDAVLARGEQLTRAGGCISCHTAAGEQELAGGRPLPSEYGTFYPPNITPHPEHGIGNWSAQDFRRAMHDGIGPDGTLYYPAFPFPWFTKLSVEDTDAIYAWLMTREPATNDNRPHNLKPLYRLRTALRGWRLLKFSAGRHQDDAAQSDAWNRGAYLVEGIGHCSACHQQRDLLGGPTGNGIGALAEGWYSPSLHAAQEAGVEDWSIAEIADLLHTGTSARGSALGPMAEYVHGGLQHLSRADAEDMAVYLKSLEIRDGPTDSQVRMRGVPEPEQARLMDLGKSVYAKHCSDCHGNAGTGSTRAIALAGNRAVALTTPVNVLNVIEQGGYLPGTASNPRPNGMPPFAHTLSDDEIAAVATYIRGAWGNEAGAVSPTAIGETR